jgi:hypothetical protein
MSHVTSIGLYVVFGVVFLPLYVMLAGWFLDTPRELRAPLIGVGYIVSLVVAIAVGMWLLGFLMSFVIGY